MNYLEPTYFPLYSVNSPLLKAALGVSDNRSVESWLNKANVPVHNIGGKKMIQLEDILRLTKTQSTKVVNYTAKSAAAKKLDDLE